MSRGDWREFGAAGLAALLLIVALPYIASWVAGNGLFRCDDAEQYRADGTNKPHIGFRLRAREGADFEEPDCQSPANQDYADLCQQRRMADSAAKTACLVDWQTGVALWGLVVLLGTLFYARNAAIYTRDASVAAQGQVRLMQAELRAWLAIDSLDADYRAIRSKDEIVVPISVKLSNTGKSAALNAKVSFTPFLEVGAGEGLRQRIDEAIARRDCVFEPSNKNIAAGKTEGIGGTIRAGRLPDDDEHWSYQMYVLVVVTYETIGHEGTAETGRTFHTLNLRIDDVESGAKQRPRFWPTDSVRQWMS